MVIAHPVNGRISCKQLDIAFEVNNIDHCRGSSLGGWKSHGSVEPQKVW